MVPALQGQAIPLIAFFGTLGAFIVVALIGAWWPMPRTRPLSSRMLTSIVASLWTSWIAVGLLHLIGLPQRFAVVSILLVALVLAAARAWRDRTPVVASDLVVLPSVLLLAVALPAWLLHADGHTFSLVFHEWDAVASWNRWALELVDGTYEPLGNLYPLLFPGVWSMIYRLQGTADVWIFAKLSLFVLVAVAALIPAFLVQARRWLPAAILAGFLVLFLAREEVRSAVLSGYMDAPLAILVTAFVAFSLVAARQLDEEEAGQDANALGVLPLVAATAGIASMAKQGGFFTLLVVGVGLLGLALAKRLSLRSALGLASLAFAPLVLYLGVFLRSDGDALGNLGHLQQLAARASGDTNPILAGLVDLFGVLPSWSIIGFVLIGATNVLRIRTWTGRLGVLLLATAIVGALAFGACCSYQVRNGWWILPLVAGSAATALSGSVPRHETRSGVLVSLASPRVLAGALLLFGVLASFHASLLPNDRLRDLQSSQQWGIVAPPLASLIQATFEGPDANGRRFVTPHIPALWLPDMNERGVYCRESDEACVRDAVGEADEAYILMARWRPYAFFDEPRRQATLVGTAAGFSLYGPLSVDEGDGF